MKVSVLIGAAGIIVPMFLNAQAVEREQADPASPTVERSVPTGDSSPVRERGDVIDQSGDRDQAACVSDRLDHTPLSAAELSYSAAGVKFPAALLPAADLAAKACFEAFLKQVNHCGDAASDDLKLGYDQIVIDYHNIFSGYTNFQINVALSASADQNLPLFCSARMNEGRLFDVDRVEFDKQVVAGIVQF